jgi:exodeoxyribonuclease VII small subunit
MENDTNTFEKSYTRLEKILETLNSSQVSLEDSLKLFEEANSLIMQCEKKLSTAGQKIEALIKNRDNSLMLSDKGIVTEPFSPTSQQSSLS